MAELNEPLKIKDFDFDLPEELIAQHPSAKREDSRLMIVRRKGGTIEHSTFKQLPEFAAGAGALVLNDSRVIPARIWGRNGEREIEFLFVQEKKAAEWEVLCRPAKRVRRGDRILFGPGFEGQVTDEGAEGLRVIVFNISNVIGELKKCGFAPLPPYIKRRKNRIAWRSQDMERYQTVYAAKDGAIAAPTAGLHFTKALLGEMARRGVAVTAVTLEVGLATFQPVRVERLEDHRMLEERYRVSPEAARVVNRAKKEGRAVIAVGTTVVRTLESAGRSGVLRPASGTTSLFIRPGFEFKIVDRLLTNFHLPRSTLLVLVSAFAGRSLILDAYQEAVRRRYRFFSYGDAMLIL